MQNYFRWWERVEEGRGRFLRARLGGIEAAFLARYSQTCHRRTISGIPGPAKRHGKDGQNTAVLYSTKLFSSFFTLFTGLDNQSQFLKNCYFRAWISATAHLSLSRYGHAISRSLCDIVFSLRNKWSGEFCDGTRDNPNPRDLRSLTIASHTSNAPDVGLHLGAFEKHTLRRSQRGYQSPKLSETLMPLNPIPLKRC